MVDTNSLIRRGQDCKLHIIMQTTFPPWRSQCTNPTLWILFRQTAIFFKWNNFILHVNLLNKTKGCYNCIICWYFVQSCCLCCRAACCLYYILIFTTEIQGGKYWSLLLLCIWSLCHIACGAIPHTYHLICRITITCLLH